MSKTKDNNLIKKYIPQNILSTLSYVDYDTFPYKFEDVADKEKLRILSYFIKTGKSFKDIRLDLLEISKGEMNELSSFVNSYPRKSDNTVISTIIMFFLGFVIAFGLLKGLMLSF